MRVLLLLLALQLGAFTYGAYADDPIAPAEAITDPAPTIDPGFLLLPAYDVDSPIKSGKVGDRLELSLHNVKEVNTSSPDLKLELELPPGDKNSLLDQGWEVSAVISRGNSDFAFVAVPLKSGVLKLPMLALVQGGKRIARLNPWSIEIQSAIKKDDPKPQEPVPVKPPSSLAFPIQVVVGGGLLVLLLVAAAIYAFMRAKKRRGKPAPPPEPPKPEDEVALAALMALEKSSTLGKGEFKTYYFKASEILRTYIGARFGFDAMEMTTRELLDELMRLRRSRIRSCRGFS